MDIHLHDRNRTVEFNIDKSNNKIICWLEIIEDNSDSSVTIYFDSFKKAIKFKDMIVDAMAEITMNGQKNEI